MKTYSVHFGVRVTPHRAHAIDYAYQFVIKDSPTHGHALDTFSNQLDVWLADLTDNLPLTVSAADRLEMISAASCSLRDAAHDNERWPAQLLLEDTDDYGVVTGRVWLTVTNWASDRDVVEVRRAY